jgi:signal transduction histidine kinase
VRTPLNAVINYLEIVLEQPLSENVKQNLVSAHSSSKSLLYVVEDLLHLTGSQSDLIPEMFEAFDLKMMIEGVIETLRHFADRKGLILSLIIQPDVRRYVRGEMQLVQRSLTNLITNALKYTEKGDIIVTWSRMMESETELTRISVKDTGRGISEMELDTIFQEMEQISYDASDLDDTMIRHAGRFGLGLGLASVGMSLITVELVLLQLIKL